MKDERSPEMVALDEQIKQRVLLGMDFLRRTYGEDWVDHITLETLDLTSASACVLGQVHPAYYNCEHEDDGYKWSNSGYDEATAMFEELRGDDGESLGFTTYWSDEDGDGPAWKLLQAAWEEVIPDEKRRVERKRQAGLLHAAK